MRARLGDAAASQQSAPCASRPCRARRMRIAMDQWEPLIAEASRRFGVPESWIRAVMRAESGGQTMLDGRPITSRAGAMGLMQVMPETYDEMRRRHRLGADPYDPHDNILAGAAYLREMYDRYGYPGFLAAYNAGPERYDDYLMRGRALPQETLGLSRGDKSEPQGHRPVARPLQRPVPGRPTLVRQTRSYGSSVWIVTFLRAELRIGRAGGGVANHARRGACALEERPLVRAPACVGKRELPPAMAPGGPAIRTNSRHRDARSADLPVSHGKARVVVPDREQGPVNGAGGRHRSLTGGKGLVSVSPCYQPGRSARQGCAVPPKCCAFWLPRAPLARRLRRP